MAMTQTDVQEGINRVINMAKGGIVGVAPASTVSTITSIMNTLVTALGTDTTTHDRTIEKPPAALLPDLGN